MQARWRGPVVYAEVYPHVLRIENERYIKDGAVPDCFYEAVNNAVHEVNNLMPEHFKMVPRNNTGGSWETLPKEKETETGLLRFYFFLENHDQEQEPVGGKGAGNAQSWQKTTKEGFRSYEYPVFGVRHNPDFDLNENPNLTLRKNPATRYVFEEATTPEEAVKRFRWAMLHELFHGLGAGHDTVEGPTIGQRVPSDWDYHFYPNDIKFLHNLYGYKNDKTTEKDTDKDSSKTETGTADHNSDDGADDTGSGRSGHPLFGKRTEETIRERIARRWKKWVF